MRTSLRRSACLFGFTCLILATVSCSDRHSLPGQTDLTSSVNSAPAAEPEVKSPSQSLADAGPVRKTRVPDPGAVAISLTRITVSHQGGHDEAVFEFTGNSMPGWVVQYVDYATQNGTGAILPIPGDRKSVV